MRSPAEIHIYTWIHYTEAKTRARERERPSFLLSTRDSRFSPRLESLWDRYAVFPLRVLLPSLPLVFRLREASEKPRGYVVDYRDCTLKLTVTRLYIRNARAECLNREYKGSTMESGMRLLNRKFKTDAELF